MKDSLSSTINGNLSKIEAIVEDLPRIGKRSQLKTRADEILRLTAMVRRQANLLNVVRENKKYTPDFKQYGGGTAGKKG